MCELSLNYLSSRLLNNYCHVTNNISRVEIPNIDYWDGKKECSRLLVVYEKGIGDNIQYYRFIIELSINFSEYAFSINLYGKFFSSNT